MVSLLVGERPQDDVAVLGNVDCLGYLKASREAWTAPQARTGARRM
jgi:hypothetical protein